MIVLEDGATADDLTQLTVDWVDHGQRAETTSTQAITIGQQLTAEQ